MKKSTTVYQIVIVLLIVLSAVLSTQNLKLKKQMAGLNNHLVRLVSFFNFETDLNALFFNKELPLKIDSNTLKLKGDLNFEDLDHFVFMLVDMTLCDKCKEDQLKILNNYKNQLKEKKVGVIVVTGIANQNNESKLIRTYRIENISFPYVIVDESQLYKVFKFNENFHLQSPCYFYTDSSFKVKDTMVTDGSDNYRFEKWIKRLLN